MLPLDVREALFDLRTALDLSPEPIWAGTYLGISFENIQAIEAELEASELDVPVRELKVHPSTVGNQLTRAEIDNDPSTWIINYSDIL